MDETFDDMTAIVFAWVNPAHGHHTLLLLGFGVGVSDSEEGDVKARQRSAEFLLRKDCF